MTENNNLVSGIIGEQLNLEMMLPQIYREAPNTSEVILVSFLVTIYLLQEVVIRIREREYGHLPRN